MPKASGALRHTPNPMPTYACSAHMTPLRYIGKIRWTRAGSPWPNPRSTTVFHVHILGVYVHISYQDMKFLWSMLSLGQLYTDGTNDDNDGNNDDANDNSNNTRWTNHDCIGSLACMPNEPKFKKYGEVIESGRWLHSIEGLPDGDSPPGLGNSGDLDPIVRLLSSNNWTLGSFFRLRDSR